MKTNLTRDRKFLERRRFASRGLLAPSIDCMVDQKNFRRAARRQEVRVIAGPKVENP